MCVPRGDPCCCSLGEWLLVFCKPVHPKGNYRSDLKGILPARVLLVQFISKGAPQLEPKWSDIIDVSQKSAGFRCHVSIGASEKWKSSGNLENKKDAGKER